MNYACTDFSVKDQTINILEFASHNVSVTNIEFDCSSAKAIIENKIFEPT